MVTLERIKSGQVRAEMELINSDPYFNKITRGKEIIDLKEALEEIYDSEGLGTERYFVLHNDERIGILEFLMENPQDGQTWLGLLLIGKSWQGKGLGRQTLEMFLAVMQERKVPRVRIGVAVGNEPAHHFWMMQGFKPIASNKKEDGREIIIYERLV
ncbi:GNAT family N-acetyltransferase [Paenibacillus pinistramenti]|uniref:GNAT family N-acetyltransferase n=1 Tax=Paenibacillus pinistramenti TaxID=1768003 RepID=UPI001108ACB8|nr:GNAT family N-acetyltransferase [Paenibacillus pinistramenti]